MNIVENNLASRCGPLLNGVKRLINRLGQEIHQHSLQDDEASFIPFEPGLVQSLGKGVSVEIDGDENQIRGDAEVPFPVLADLCILCGGGIQLEYPGLPRFLLKAQRPRIKSCPKDEYLWKLIG